MKRLLLLLALLTVPAWAATPPLATGDPAADENLRDIYSAFSEHEHDNNGTKRFPPSDPAPRTNSKPRFIGDVIFNSTSLQICYATGAITSSWAVAGSSSTPCGSAPDVSSTFQTLTVSSNATVGGSLGVTGGSLLSGQVMASTNVYVGGSLNVVGGTALASLSASGNAAVTGTIKENGSRVFSGASMFESSELTLVNQSTRTATHGLGGVPRLATLVLRNKTAELGYAVGDELAMSAESDATIIHRAFWCDSTTCNVLQDGTTFTVASRVTGIGASITFGNWVWVIRAWY